MGNADKGKVGGIIALVAGLLQLGVMFGMLVMNSGSRAFDSSLGTFAWPNLDVGIGFSWGGLIFAYGTVFVAAYLLAGARGMIPGIALIVCALLGAIIGGVHIAALSLLTLIGGVISMGSGGGNAAVAGFQEVLRTAQRMAEAAKETETKETKETKD